MQFIERYIQHIKYIYEISCNFSENIQEKIHRARTLTIKLHENIFMYLIMKSLSIWRIK